MGKYVRSAIKMASFWVDAIAEGERGSTGDSHLDATMLLLKPSTAVSEDNLLDLQMDLEKIFERLLVRTGGRLNSLVDYTPDIILADTCKINGINPWLLPVKSSVSCCPDGTVVGKLGYGAKEVVF